MPSGMQLIWLDTKTYSCVLVFTSTTDVFSYRLSVTCGKAASNVGSRIRLSSSAAGLAGGGVQWMCTRAMGVLPFGGLIERGRCEWFGGDFVMLGPLPCVGSVRGWGCPQPSSDVLPGKDAALHSFWPNSCPAARVYQVVVHSTAPPIPPYGWPCLTLFYTLHASAMAPGTLTAVLARQPAGCWKPALLFSDRLCVARSPSGCILKQMTQTPLTNPPCPPVTYAQKSRSRSWSWVGV